MSQHQEEDAPSPLPGLGWSEFFASQLEPDEDHLLPCRIAKVHRTGVRAIAALGPIKLMLPVHVSTAELAVGDWVLCEPDGYLMHRRLARKSVLERRTEGSDVPQLGAANIDTLFIVTSCNSDWNAARLERYLAVANEAGIEPVVVLTKADTAADALRYETETAALQRDLPVVSLDARSRNAVDALARWCGFGQTVTLVGSSGVGKSSLVNTLAGAQQDAPQLTGAIREHDAKGRHTTTSRSLHQVAGGAWLIDTPGIRSLQVSDMASGIDTLFAEITELAPLCRFRDCTHAHEPGCAVQDGVKTGLVDPERLARWRKLTQEDSDNTSKQTASRPGASPKRGRRH